jgi:predicted ATP-binding protein involved in virulence
MKLNHLQVTNFRCFENIDVNLHPQLNVIVGVNGSGKTAFLYACRNAIGSFINSLPSLVWTEKAILHQDEINYSFDLSTNKFIRKDEIRIEFTTINPDEKGNRLLQKKVSEQKGKGGFKVNGGISKYVKETYSQIQLGEQINLPVLLMLGAERFKVEHKDYNKKILGERYEGYFNSMNGKTATYIFEKWFKVRYLDEIQSRENNLALAFSDLHQMQEAVRQFYPEAENIYYNLSSEQLILKLKTGIHKPVDDMSDGERFMFLTCATIAFYCVRLNAHLGDKCLTASSGVVMIDEIDLHLHPKWQREIIPKLIAVFPNIQFIVTTHSPQVLSSVKRENLLLLSDYKIKPSSKLIEGRDSNSILGELFDDVGRDPKRQKELDKFYELLSSEEFDKAEDILNKLIVIWGENDSAILRASFHLNDSREDA